MLQHQVGARSIEHCVEASQEHGVVDAREDLRLVPEATDCRPVVDQMRADQLCDDERVQPIVPREVRLVVVSPAEPL